MIYIEKEDDVLVRDRIRVPDWTDKHDFVYQYKWFDQDIVTQKIRDKNGKMHDMGQVSKKTQVTTTSFDWEWKARLNVDFKARGNGAVKEKDHGGFVFTSSQKFVPGNDGGKYNAQGRGPSVNIDDIISTFNMGSTGGNIRLDKGIGVDEALEYLSGARDLVNEGLAPIDFGSESSSTAECPSCGLQKDSAHIDKINGKGAYEKATNESK